MLVEETAAVGIVAALVALAARNIAGTAPVESPVELAAVLASAESLAVASAAKRHLWRKTSVLMMSILALPNREQVEAKPESPMITHQRPTPTAVDLSPHN